MEGALADPGIAVGVSNAVKNYGSSNVLSGLNMTVPEGSIYGLLGPSGCGKTTLLRCILGRLQLDQGDVVLKARKRKHIGYMPQELALQEDISVNETLNYYGRLFGLSTSQTKAAKRELFKILDLPSGGSRLVSTFSGGQKRRLSFAVALLHNPKLLILDEPTVGVDPVLRSSLWDHLGNLSRNGKTIVITTHYIEEARQAHLVGLMRGGVLLAEDTPNNILKIRNSQNLEEAFVQMCYQQSESQNNRSILDNTKTNKKKTKSRHLEDSSAWSFNRFMAQFIKNLIWCKRNLMIVIFLLLLPVLLALLINIIFSTIPFDLPLGMVSEELPEGFSKCKGGRYDFCSNITEPLPCGLWNYLSSETLTLKDYPSVEAAKDAVRSGHIWGVLYFQDNYTESLLERIEQGGSIEDEGIDSSTVDIWLDMSNAWISSLLKVTIRENFIDFLKSILVSCDYSARLADIPIQFQQAIFGDNTPLFVHYALPGILCPFCFYLAMMFTSGAILMEKSLGLLDRSLSAGVTFMEVVFAHIGAETLILGLQTVILLVIDYGIYDNPMVGSFFEITLLIILLEAMGTAYGFLLALYFDTETMATYAGVGTLVVLFMMEGVIWPFEGMHFILRKTVWMWPVLPAITSYQGIARKGWTLTHPEVLFGFCQSTVWILIFTLASYITFKFRKLGNK